MDGWIEHTGDVRPVDALAVVEYQLPGDLTVYRDTAGRLYWGNDPEAGIMRYRVLAPVPVEPEEKPMPGPANGRAAPASTELVRAFATGATRSADATRYDPEAFMSPIVIERFCEYMQKHRVQPDGSVRDGDNWQRGMPLASYMKGTWRHFLHLWTRYRGFKVNDEKAAADMEEDLCALLFNINGMLFEMLKDKRRVTVDGEAVPERLR